MKKEAFHINDFTYALSPYKTENLFSIISCVKENKGELSFFELKRIVLFIIKYCLENKVFYKIDEITKNHEFIRTKMSSNEILKLIDCKWTNDTEYIDLYLLVWFRFENWYIKNLVKKGLFISTNWNEFVKKEIGDFEKWVKNTKPKNKE